MTASLIETKPRKGEGAGRNFPSRHVSNPLLESGPDAGVAKLVDAPDLGSGAARRGGSSPSTRTTLNLEDFGGLNGQNPNVPERKYRKFSYSFRFAHRSLFN